MGEFESAVAEARAANRPLDVPMPQVSEATIEAVREQIEREQRGLSQSVRHAAQRDADQQGQQLSRDVGQDASHATGHEAPSLELEP